MGTTGRRPRSRAAARRSQLHPDVVKWIDRLDEFAEEVARKKDPKRTRAWKPKQKDKAVALDVSEGTYSRWYNGVIIPWDNTLQSAPAYAEADPATQLELLGLLQAARVHRPDRVAQAKSIAASGSLAETIADLETATTSAATSPPNTASDGSAAALTPPNRQDNITDILRDTRDESDIDPGGERGSNMPTSATQEQDTGHLRSPDQHAAGAAPQLPPHLVEAATALATHLFDHWEDVAAERQLDLPPPLPVRWSRSQLPVAGSVEVAVGPRTRSPFPPVPGTPTITAERVQAGDLDDLFVIYGGLRSGRIVLLGDPGSGKTGTAILMLLNALNHRRALRPKQRTHAPVPVLLTAYGWDPRHQTLGDWFASQLASTYELLRADQYGSDAASKLVRHGAVSLLLDGFDEMDSELRKAALLRIRRERRTFRLVVLSRTKEFVDAAKAGHLHGAVALELSPTSTDDALHYLRLHQCERNPKDDALQLLIDHLQHEPNSPVTQALTSPLALTLVRDDPQAIKHLLASGRFHTSSAVKDYLLSRVVPLAWGSDQPPGPTPQQAERWLGYLATQTRTHHGDLAWWRMHHWMPARWRLLANTLIGIVVMGCIGPLLFGPIGRYTMDGHTGTLFGIIYGTGMGALFGFLGGLVSELRELHPDRQGRVWSTLRRWSKRFNPAIGLLIGVAVMMAVGNQSSYLFGIPAGLTAGYVAGRAAVHVRLVSPTTRSWRKALWPNRADILSALIAGTPIGLAYGITKTTQHGIIAGLVTTFVFGLMIRVSRPIAGPDIAADPATLWRRDRRRGLMVGLAAGIPLALALGIKNGDAHGLLAGITATITHALIITAGCMVGICDSWRTTLLFGQLRLRKAFPLHGMYFLQDARTRGVLRTAGPYLQFRHARLRDTLADLRQGSSTPRSTPT